MTYHSNPCSQNAVAVGWSAASVAINDVTLRLTSIDFEFKSWIIVVTPPQHRTFTTKQLKIELKNLNQQEVLHAVRIKFAVIYITAFYLQLHRAYKFSIRPFFNCS